jgi:hypothetical protein
MSTGDDERPLRPHRLVQVLALEELHDDVERAVLELAEMKDPDRVRVRQLAHRPGFAPEPTDEVFPVGELRVEDLDPHHAIHLGLMSLVDRAHPPGPHLLENLEGPVQYGASDERVRRGHGASVQSGITSRFGASCKCLPR